MVREDQSTLELGGPGGTGYSDLMRSKPKNARGLTGGQHTAAAMSGVGQALMGGRMGRAFNAAAGGYQDLYKAKAYPDALHQQVTGPSIDDPSVQYADLKKRMLQARAGMGQVQGGATIPQGGSAL